MRDKKQENRVEQLEFAEVAAIERAQAEPEEAEEAERPIGEQTVLPGFEPAPEREAPTPPEAESASAPFDPEAVLKEFRARENAPPVLRRKGQEYALARFPVPEKLVKMAERMTAPLYLVGGAVRNFLIAGKPSGDWDVAAPCDADEALAAAKEAGLRCVAVYPRTGTFRLKDGAESFEFTSFRTEEYAPGGGHVPERVRFTKDMTEDAMRRDFRCNAIYFDVLRGEIVDPVGGREDVLRRTLSTPRPAAETFGSDGLRLMRLARFAGELGFDPDAETLAAATAAADNILDVSPERIYEELMLILNADGKYPFSPEDGHERALKLLDETRVLDRILPELAAGRGMAQRKDFHRYDVLGHTIRTVRYAAPGIRLAALLHDAGKPAVFRETGRFHGHDAAGAAIAAEILARLRAPARVRERTAMLVGLHMYDLDGKAGKNRVRLFLAEHSDAIDDLMLLRQADYRGCMDARDECPTLAKWRAILDEMRADGAPISLKDLAIDGKRLAEMGYRGKEIGEELSELRRMCVLDPALNRADKLEKIAERKKSRSSG